MIKLNTYKVFCHKNWDKIILFFFIAAYIYILVSLSIARHNTFASRFDLSNMDQTLWYTIHGHFFSLRYPDLITSRFAVHSDLILVLLSPIYLVWNDVRALIALESLFLGLGALPVYLISKRVLKNKIISLAIAFVYLLNPGMQWTDLYDFHGVSLAIPFILFAFYFGLTKHWKSYWVFISLALLTKEQIALNISVLGFFTLFQFKNRLTGIITIILGAVWFLAMVFWIMPHFTPTGIHWALKDFEGSTPIPTMQNMQIMNLLKNYFIDKSTFDYYILLIKPFAFLPLMGLPWIFISAPDIAINVLRNTKSINFHYDSGVTPSLALATIYGFFILQKILSYLIHTKKLILLILYCIAFCMVLIALRVNYHYGPLPITPSCWCQMYKVTQEDRDFEKVLQRIPKYASVTSSLEIRPHISHREYGFALPSATESADFIAIITQNRIPGNYEPKDFENILIPILLSNQTHKVIFKSEHFYLFEKVKKGDNTKNFSK